MVRSTREFEMKIKFQETLIKCRNAMEAGEGADWALFVRSYSQLLQALREFETLPIGSSLIKQAWNKQYKQSFRDLETLENSLRVRGMI